ncbi:MULTISPECIES: hypothetical protein [Nonomuraea]|uniref:Uncharacterized protein n=3 Tax=Nonomuraea TaxID=83681 RepID=A0A7W5VAS5_9ACTN|nr:hypothetical protein [Nonomuraea dietziae]MBB3732659.1 hypothetical protein [Nonomuraea dietziae]
MPLIDSECVRKLLESGDPDATLVFVRGDCVVMPGGEVDDAHRGLVIARRSDLREFVPGEHATEQELQTLADRLDNVVRDLGA